jgi:hypothetical protein
LRILHATTKAAPRYTFQASGYFNDTEALIKALFTLRTAKGVYITLQPCNPVLLARAQNRLRTADEMRKASATADTHIIAYRWLLIDTDPDHPADISSSEEEHQAALEHARYIRQVLREEDWPEPIYADSGNGGHLLFLAQLPRGDHMIYKCRIKEIFGKEINLNDLDAAVLLPGLQHYIGW